MFSYAKPPGAEFSYFPNKSLTGNRMFPAPDGQSPK